MAKTKPLEIVEDDNDPDLLEIEFNGATFTVLKDRDEWSVDSELALYEARATELSYWWTKWVELALGPVQWDKLLTETLTKRGDLIKFVQHFVVTVAQECNE